MSMLQQLGHIELDMLRKEIELRYASRHRPADRLKLNAYLPNYQELQEAMKEAVPEYRQAVSARRLRKLFYYANPAVCPESQLKAARFNGDFLDACYLYATKGAATRASYLRERPFPEGKTRTGLYSIRRRYVVAALLLAGLAALALWLIRFPGKPQNGIFFTQHFGETNWEELQKAGWEVWNSAAGFPPPQSRPGWFALPTLPAKKKMHKYDNLLAQNLIVHPLRCDCCLIEAWMEFVPEKDWQQAGLLLIGEQDSSWQYKLASKVYAGHFVPQDPIKKDSLFVFMAGFQQDFMEGYHAWLPMAEIGMGAEPFQKFENCLFFRVRADKESIKVWVDQREKHLVNFQQLIHPFLPQYLALFATHGQTANNLVKADTTPVYAYFDYVKVRPCGEASASGTKFRGSY